MKRPSARQSHWRSARSVWPGSNGARPTTLSGGEKKKVAIAGVLAMDPDILVFDEPTSGLDPSGSEDLMELLDELNHEGKTIFISTHDVELAYPWADRVILLLDGKILEENVPAVAFGDPEMVRKAHPFRADPPRIIAGARASRVCPAGTKTPQRS